MNILGTTDEVTTCDCCGREDLTKTVAVDTDGSVSFFGVVCAAKLLSVSSKDIQAKARKADAAKAEAARVARQKAAEASFAAQQAMLDAMFPEVRGQRFAQVGMLIASGRLAMLAEAGHA